MNPWDTLILNPMINVLLLIYNAVGANFGISIILFTLLIRLLTHPLTVQQLKSTSALQDLQKSKKWQDMQKKYKNNREKLAQEQMKLYKEAGVSPFGSCLPTLIQFPIIIGLYQAIIRAVAVSPQQLIDLASRIDIYPILPKISNLIPLNSTFLWMDLSQPERLPLSFLPPDLPFLGGGIPILAILVVITTYLQSKLMTPTTGSPGDQAAAMGQMMSLYMPLLLGYFALTFASGLALYFVASNLFTVGQYIALGRINLKEINWQDLLPFLKRS